VDVDEIVAAQYAQRLREKTGMFVQSVPVARKHRQKAVYHLVFGTRSEHGLWFFGDAVARARDAWWEGLEIRRNGKTRTLFSPLPRWSARTRRRSSTWPCPPAWSTRPAPEAGRPSTVTAPVKPPVRFGFGSVPRKPALSRVTTTVALGLE
jgi:hypothetical protein